MPTNKPPRRVKVTPVMTPAKEGPPCPRHGDPMVFSPVYNHWYCTVDECPMISHPKKTYDPSRPTVLTGSIEILFEVSDEPGAKARTFIKHVESNTLIDITNMVAHAEVDAQPSNQMVPHTTVTLKTMAFTLLS